jgi:hypothetical protein
MPLHTDIKTFSLSAIVRLVHAENKTGVLKVARADHSAGLHFKQGKIVFISGSLTQDLSLGSLLKAGNIIRQEDILKSMQIAEETGKHLGAILVEREYITRTKLVSILRYKYREVIARVLTWKDGEFSYTDGLSDYFDELGLNMDPIRMLADAQKWKEYRNLIPNDQVVFQIKDGTFEPDPFSGDSVSRVMLLINGRRNVAQIINETGLTRLTAYRALAALAYQGAIARQEVIGEKAEADHLDDATLIKFYLNILDAITAGMVVELGSQKAAALFKKSLKRTPYYETICSVFRPEADVTANFQLIIAHLRKQSKRIIKQDLIKGFNFAIVNLLQDEYQHLGLKATQNAINRALKDLERLSHSQKYLARTVGRLLTQCCEDEDLLRGKKRFSETADLDPQSPRERSQSLPGNLDNIDATAIITFYSYIIQTLLHDLESDIGAKALDLYRDIVTRSEYYDIFFSQFDITDRVSSNVHRIREHIRARKHTFGKQNMVRAFQQVLLALIEEEHRLLGDKAVRMSLSKLKEYVADPAQKNYPPLADHLTTFLENRTIWKRV